MATGRSLTDFQKLYIDGYNMSGYAFDAGEQGVEYQEFGDDKVPFDDAIKGVLCGKPKVTLGPINAVLDNTATSGVHVLATAAQGTRRNVMLVRGVQAVPAVGDDVFCAPMYQIAYKGVPNDGIVTCRLDMAGPDVVSGLLYDEFWGKLIHAWGSESAANSSNTPNVDNGAASAAGGWLMWMIYSISGGAGTVTVSIDDSANGTSWSALSGATSGAIAYNAVPAAGIVQLGTTATVRQYLRWQYAEAGGATDAIFALAFMRGR